MKTAILTLTCGRLEMTVETWRHNFANHGAGDVRVFWFDNGSTPDELAVMMEEAAKWRFAFTQFETQNKGIAYALNWMMKAAFATGAHAVATMANDIKEPNGWLDFRIRAAKDIYHTGVVAVAVDQSTRYPPKHVNGWMIEEGTVIGNWLITRDVYDAIGGFCMDYGTYGPVDIDYCERMKAAGWRYYYLHDLYADHIGQKEANPAQYQAEKNASLNKSWEVYKRNLKLYRQGKNVYQHD